LGAFWETLINLFEHDRASGRGEMGVKGLYIFSHDNAYGKARTSDLFNRITTKRLNTTPRTINDYKIDISDVEHPGVTFTPLVG
jgi:CRISPR-associated protein Csd2